MASTNAMLLDRNGNVFDYFGGQSDLAQGILHPTSAAFKEDPLRVLRAMQFTSRFNMDASLTLIHYAREIAAEYQHLSVDRVREEWLKWSLGEFPHKGIKLLEQCGWLEHFQEIDAIRGIPQSPLYHAEGDVFRHTLMVLEQAGRQQNSLITFAALCHDFGKAEYTVISADGEITSPKHNDPSSTFSFCRSIGLTEDFIARVASLVREHMFDVSEATPRTIRRLLTRLATPNDFEPLCQLLVADRLGRIPQGTLVHVNLMRSVYRELGADAIKPIVLGRHLIAAGLTPGPHFSARLKAAFEAQLDGGFEFDELLQIALST